MSGTVTTITANAGLFRDYTTDNAQATDLETAVTNALASIVTANAAVTSAQAAAASATTSAANASSASTAAIAAVNAAATTAEASVNSAASAASTSQTQAAASATAAAASATAANTSATTAASAVATSASAAASSASAAATSATAASGSASAAASSNTAASGSASAAATSATGAAGSATAAATSATNAATSASSAASAAGAAAGAAVAAFAPQTIGRNYVENGRFQVQQRGAGPFSTSGLTADRWRLGVVGDTSSVALSSLPFAGRSAIGDEAATYYAGITFTGASAAADLTQFYQYVENVQRLSGKTVTLSFWASSAATLTIGVYMGQNFGTGGSPSAQVNQSPQTVSIGTTWARNSLTFTLPSVSGKTLGTNGDHATLVSFGLSSGTTNAATLGVGVQSGYVNLYGVQLELGSTATPLEVKNYDYDLKECERFYQTVSVAAIGYGTASGYVGSSVSFGPMRAVPTAVLVTAGSATNANTPTLQPYTLRSGQFVVTATAAGGVLAQNYLYSLSADL